MTAPIPDKIRFTVGHLVEMPFEPLCRWNRGENGKKIYWRRGIRAEVKEWLLENVGERCQSNADWDPTDIGKWVYLGAQSNSITRGGGEIVRLRFRDKESAMLFKLAWSGHL